jgi:hypothetical protein
VTSLLPRGTADAVLRRLAPTPAQTAIRDPVDWVQGALGEYVWSKQQEIFQALKTHRKVCVQSCHGIGKSWSASRALAWWIDAHPKGEAMALSSAPSSHQVKTILWGELRRAHRKAALPGYITQGQVPEWIIDGDQVAFGRKPADYVDQEEARTQFQGIHARYLLVALDEACGVPQWLWEATETLVTNEASRILAIGNPDDPTSYFAKMCAPGSGWHVIQVSVFDTPNFTGEPVPEYLRESLVSKLWVEERRREWGEDSPLYISKVLGQFPEVSDETIITPKMVREAHERDRTGHMIGDRGRYGMDVAEFGKDETAIYLNRGGVIRREDSWRKQDVDVSRARAQLILERDIYRPIYIDVVGLGAGVVRPLAHAGFRVTPFNGGEAALDPDRFVNRNSEVWWAFREGMEAGLIDLDPEDELLAAQLQSRRWSLDSSQRRIRIETKGEMAKRGVKSPDRADAAILSYVDPGYRVPDPSVVLARSPFEDDGSVTGDLLGMAT